MNNDCQNHYAKWYNGFEIHYKLTQAFLFAIIFAWYQTKKLILCVIIFIQKFRRGTTIKKIKVDAEWDGAKYWMKTIIRYHIIHC